MHLLTINQMISDLSSEHNLMSNLTLPGWPQKVLSMPRHSASWHYGDTKIQFASYLLSIKYVYRELT